MKKKRVLVDIYQLKHKFNKIYLFYFYLLIQKLIIIKLNWYLKLKIKSASLS